MVVSATRVDFFWDMLNRVSNISGDEIGNCWYGVFYLPSGRSWSYLVRDGWAREEPDEEENVFFSKNDENTSTRFLLLALPSCSGVLLWTKQSSNRDGSDGSPSRSSTKRSSGGSDGGFSVCWEE